MQINEQELAEAADRLREGESVMGLTNESVYKKMGRDTEIICYFFNQINGREHLDYSEFDKDFEEAARDLLTEALRTHKEQQAGLM